MTRAVRAPDRCRSAATRTTALDATEIVDELRAQAALAVAARVRRRDDERAPRRVRGLPAEPVAARGLPARRDGRTVGRRRARCCCRCARPRSSPRRSAWLAARFPGPGRPRGRGRRARRRLRDHGRAHGRPHRPIRRAASSSLAAALRVTPPGRSRPIPRSWRVAEHPIPVLERGRERHRRAARGALPVRVAVRFARHAGAVRELSTRTAPRRRRAVRADPPGVARRTAAPRSTARSTCTAERRAARGAGALGRRRDGRLGADRRRGRVAVGRGWWRPARGGADASNLRVPRSRRDGRGRTRPDRRLGDEVLPLVRAGLAD